MRVSLDWLQEWVDAGTDVAALAHALTMAGLEIEGIERAAPEIEGVVVGEVVAVTKHPEADKLKVCRVQDGTSELQIVCGASNVYAGLKAPLARVGAKLPGIEIKKAKLRGVESFGMLCSASELGLDDTASGLLELPATLAPGQSVVEALALDARILEVNLTPNRGDCMSVIGVAREVAATRGVELRGLRSAPVPVTLEDTFEVKLEAEQGCPKFAGRVIRGIRAGARSPLWLRERLRRAGMRPINAVVDVTNYVMLELGQPMHAYDLAQLHEAVVVRFARAGEALTLLDGRVLNLDPDVLVIADTKKAVALAGVMGGQDSGINDATTDLFLEVAFFDPDTIAGRGRRYGLVTEASQRFERGVDPQLQERAIERATELLLECAGGEAGPIRVARAERPLLTTWPARKPVTLRHERLQSVLGVQLDAAAVAGFLHRLGMHVTAKTDGWEVVPPSWRFDIAIEEDLIEEVARLHGFDHIPEILPAAPQSLGTATEKQVLVGRVADLLVDRGYREAITYSFVDPALQSILFPDQPGFALKNPMSAELAVMRVSVWPGLLQVARDNLRRQQARVRLFEVGRKFASDSTETDVIAGIVMGAALPEQWSIATAAADFFDVKGDIEALLSLTGALGDVRFEADRHSALQPGQTARIWRGEQPIGWLGTLHPAAQQRLEMSAGAVLFEIETQAGLAVRLPQFVEIPKYPSIRRDLAVVVAESVTVEALRAAVRESAGGLLVDLDVLSVFRGEKIEKNKKSVALRLILQDISRTLTDGDAESIITQVVAHLGRRFDAELRDK